MTPLERIRRALTEPAAYPRERLRADLRELEARLERAFARTGARPTFSKHVELLKRRIDRGDGGLRRRAALL